jgi:hypothetical protein
MEGVVKIKIKKIIVKSKCSLLDKRILETNQ